MDNKASEWLEKWMESVRVGGGTMSQRSLSNLERKGASLAALRKIARSRGIHILLIEDEQGRQLLAASVRPFKVIC